MTQTQWVTTLGKLKQACGISLCAVTLLSCRDAPSDDGPSTGSSPVEKGEESPNARILPDPLREGKPIKSSEKRREGTLEESTEPRERPLPIAWSTTGALDEDPLKHIAVAGYRAKLSLSWFPAQRSARVDEKELSLWPSFEVQLLRETSTRIARMRLIMTSSVFPFPIGTELRARGDRHGHVLLWPDGRSYRVVPSGALRSLFNDRRVDRVPFVEAIVKVQGGPEAVAGEPRVSEIVTPIAQARLTSTQLVGLPYASTLLCDTLLELIRVEATALLCPEGYVPLKLEVVWSGDSKLQVDLAELKPATDLEVEQFRAPPALPIFKRGELPPFESYLLSERARYALLPLTHEAKDPVATSPPAPSVVGAEAAPMPAPAPAELRPSNELVLVNNRDRLLFVMLGRVPFVWLGPGDKVPLLLKTNEVRVSARDFLGEYILAEESRTPPTQVHLGSSVADSPSTD